MTKPSPAAAPFVVVPLPGQAALGVALNRPVRDRFGRELLAGMTCGFEKASAVSLVMAGWGTAHCFDEAAATAWLEALKPHFSDDTPLAQVLHRLSGPFIETVKAKMDAEKAALDAEDRAEAERKATADAQAAAQKLAEDQAAAEAAAYAKLQEQVKAQEEAARAAGVDPVQTAPVTAEATVSSPSADAEALKEPAPQPTPPAAPPSSKRGNKSPR